MMFTRIDFHTVVVKRIRKCASYDLSQSRKTEKIMKIMKINAENYILKFSVMKVTNMSYIFLKL